MTDQPDNASTESEEIREPDSGIENNWLGQRIDRDKELADQIAEETDDEGKAARRFEKEKEGPRPEDLPTEERP